MTLGTISGWRNEGGPFSLCAVSQGSVSDPTYDRKADFAGCPLLLAVIVLNFILIQSAPGSFLDVMSAEQQVNDASALVQMFYCRPC
jgi:hypothetical protein